MIDQQLEELFRDRPLAKEFLYLFSSYVSLIDDTVDEIKDSTREQHKCYLASKMYNCQYWKQYSGNLILLERIISVTYFDSVKWEKTNEAWKRHQSKVDSHSAMLMVFAVILIEFGYETLTRFSIDIKERAYDMHKADLV